MLDGEPVLGFLPVRATLDMGYEYLDKESRVNYARLEFVEHHVLVCFVGRISPKDFEKIVAPAVEYFCDRRREFVTEPRRLCVYARGFDDERHSLFRPA